MSGSEDSKIYLWDLQTREIMQVLDGHQGWYNSSLFEKESSSLIINGELRSVFVLYRRRCCRRCEPGDLLKVSRIFILKPICFFFTLQTHPQQNMIASGSMDSDLTVKVWVDRGSST